MMEQLLSPAQFMRLLRGENMTPLIYDAKRSICGSCGGNDFQKKKSPDFANEMPGCKCGGRPNLFRVVFKVPIVGTDKFERQEKVIDQKGIRLDTASRADAFCEYLKEKLSLGGDNDFDPRTIGTKEQREYFIVKNNYDHYLAFHKKRLIKNEITPGGYVKKDRVKRLSMIPLFGNVSVKDLGFQLLNKTIKQSDLTDSSIEELLKELSAYFEWCCMEGLITSKPTLPKPPKKKSSSKISKKNVYTFKERNLVIRNITFSSKHKEKKRKLQIGIMFLAAYANRKSEIICLRWSDIDFKKRKISFGRHMSLGKGVVPDKELKGLKSSPDTVLEYDFFPGCYELLIELGPKLNSDALVFSGRNGEMLPENAFYNAWSESAWDLIQKDLLDRHVSLHRGLRSSTLNAAQHAGFGKGELTELYGGDAKTMSEFYLEKKKEDISKLLTFSSSFSNEVAN